MKKIAKLTWNFLCIVTGTLPAWVIYGLMFGSVSLDLRTNHGAPIVDVPGWGGHKLVFCGSGLLLNFMFKDIKLWQRLKYQLLQSIRYL